MRLSPEVFEELRGWAGQEMRSLNGHIEYLLRRAVEERKRGGKRPGA
ncbi:MAG: toxin-antitoxin system HicB family antitoxin [Planctomycetes bacterium]|nr:toxin-antitoxin system HicB family antitoxin [Planctomycetota bacterium]